MAQTNGIAVKRKPFAKQKEGRGQCKASRNHLCGYNVQQKRVHDEAIKKKVGNKRDHNEAKIIYSAARYDKARKRHSSSFMAS